MPTIGESSYEPSTLRQTYVMVIPGSDGLQSFAVFDALVNAINEARRNARDYVTDLALEKLDDRMTIESENARDEPSERDWSVSVNCAHLHPQFGEMTAEQRLQQMKEEDESGEVDVNLQQYKEKRLLARRSPYPSVVIEVRAVPPPDFGRAPPPPPPMPYAAQLASSESDEKEISEADIQKLEALFGKSAYMNQHPTADLSPKQQEESFYDSIGGSIEEVLSSPITPLNMAQEWIAKNDADALARSSGSVAFTESSAQHVDEAYQFVFTNLAMLKESAAAGAAEGDSAPGQQKSERRQYLVMPRFLSSSATSFEKFSKEVQNIADALPDLKGRASIETFHPEHVDPDRRSPIPVFAMVWKE